MVKENNTGKTTKIVDYRSTNANDVFDNRFKKLFKK